MLVLWPRLSDLQATRRPVVARPTMPWKVSKTGYAGTLHTRARQRLPPHTEPYGGQGPSFGVCFACLDEELGVPSSLEIERMPFFQAGFERACGSFGYSAPSGSSTTSDAVTSLFAAGVRAPPPWCDFGVGEGETKPSGPRPPPAASCGVLTETTFRPTCSGDARGDTERPREAPPPKILPTPPPKPPPPPPTPTTPMPLPTLLRLLWL
mmetsp:Transcript_1252/g.3655  ORF Transcript_1252/g.3655 Transcript_1252/m.3655 type:complete len:209 (+) Transcript_1252:33-659(+)